MFTFALAGLLAGSFLNSLIDRFPREESIFAIRSRCDSCGEPVRIAHRIPIFGSILARRHSRSCGARFPIRHLAVEIGTALLFAVIWLRYPGSLETMLVAFFSSLLIVFLVIDLERGTILDRVSHPRSRWPFCLASGSPDAPPSKCWPAERSPSARYWPSSFYSAPARVWGSQSWRPLSDSRSVTQLSGLRSCLRWRLEG